MYLISFIFLSIIYGYITITAAYGLPSSYVNIKRTQLKHVRVTTLNPKGWLNKSIKYSNRAQRGNKSGIREIVYLPNIIPLLWSDDPENALDDDHICSKLCDKGFIVHVLSSSNPSDLLSFDCSLAMPEFIKWSTGFDKDNKSSNQNKTQMLIEASNLAIIGNELIIPKLLNWLSESVTETSRPRFEVGAVILLDPPPLQAISLAEGRERILRRYSEALLSPPAYRRHVLPYDNHILTNDDAEQEWRQYLKRLKKNPALNMLLHDLAVLKQPSTSNIPSTSGSPSSTTSIWPPRPIPPPSPADIEDDIFESLAASAGFLSSKRPLTTADVMGSRPTNAYEVALALPNRILVLSSDDIRPVLSFDHHLRTVGYRKQDITVTKSTTINPVSSSIYSESSPFGLFPMTDNRNDDDRSGYINDYMKPNNNINNTSVTENNYNNTISSSFDRNNSSAAQGVLDYSCSSYESVTAATYTDKYSYPEENSDPDDWGLAAAEELSNLYRAGIVITIPPRCRSRVAENIKPAPSPCSSASPYTSRGSSSSASKGNSSSSRDGLNGDKMPNSSSSNRVNSYDSEYRRNNQNQPNQQQQQRLRTSTLLDEDPASWHKEVADIIADWLSMLVVFEYL